MLPSSLLGLIFALALYAVSVSPSLLPRSWWWHAAVSGVLMSAGYLLGIVVQTAGAWAMRATGLRITASERAEQLFPWVLLSLFLVWFLRAVVMSFLASRRAAALVDMPAESPRGYVLGVVGALVLAYVLVGLAGALAWVGSRVVHLLDRWLPEALAWVIAGAAVGLVVFLLTSRVLLHGVISFFSRHAWTMNSRTARGIFQPTEAERSGSRDSLSSWESVGGQGRVFLGRGPRRADIEAVTGRPAKEPIRVYAGMPQDPKDLAARAGVVVEELRRTGAFDRAVIVVSTATGSGWVDEWQVQPVEYLTGGDCATASMQYSYVPSSINVLTGLDVSVEASRQLFRAVREALDEVPEHRRPALYISGESLGAFASQEVFADLDDVMAGVSGALWVGTPSFTPLHRALTRARHRGSPEVAPVYDNARHVRFVNAPEDLTADVYGRELGPWGHPRVVFAQHPSDPVVWCWWDLIWDRPDWLRERAGRDVSRDMEFTRGATFIQVLADLPVAGTAPGGHGHTYHEELVPLWEGILGLNDGSGPARLGTGEWVDPDMRTRIGQAVSANIAMSDRQ